MVLEEKWTHNPIEQANRLLTKILSTQNEKHGVGEVQLYYRRTNLGCHLTSHIKIST